MEINSSITCPCRSKLLHTTFVLQQSCTTVLLLLVLGVEDNSLCLPHNHAGAAVDVAVGLKPSPARPWEFDSLMVAPWYAALACAASVA